MPDLTPEDLRPPKIDPRILAAPAIRQLYWCDLWKEAQLPEFHKTRPVLIVSYKNTLHGHCTILPLTTTSQPNNYWTLPIQHSLSPLESWVVCNHPITIATSRLCPPREKIPRISEEEFAQILSKLLEWLPK
jgi:mRNA interferase MazF